MAGSRPGWPRRHPVLTGLAGVAALVVAAGATPLTGLTDLIAAVPTEPTAASTEPTAAATEPTTGPATSGVTAMALLDAVTVKGRAPATGYSREQFGQSWADTDRNGCDTRNDMLGRDLTDRTFRPGTRDCVVLSGELADPYTGTVVRFSRSDASAVQIDHVVSLSNAWQTGAFAWTDQKRLAFANDPVNLLAVDGPSNQAKSAGDAATWLPPNRAYRCAFVARQVAVKVKYDLWLTPPERDAVARVLQPCPGQPAPTDGTVASPVSSPPAGTSGSATDPRFDSCRLAKAEGLGPYQRGSDVEYDWYRDGDSDGIACE